MKDAVLEALKGAGFLVSRVRYTVKCSRCEHEWTLNIPADELERRTEPNPNWFVCWPCKSEEKGGAQ